MAAKLAEMSIAEIRTAMEKLLGELARRAATTTQPGEPASAPPPKPTRLIITLPQAAYNEKRYEKPWIGRIVAWPVGEAERLGWGEFVGNGKAGVLEIAAMPGDVLKFGQEDTRGNNSTTYFGIVQEDGSLVRVDRTAAHIHYRNTHQGRSAP
jgi:hypothetical protein